MTGSVQIQIMGQSFMLKGSHDTDYVNKVEKYINNKIEEIRKNGGPVDSKKLLILVALNAADDYFQQKDELEKVIKSVEDTAADLINTIDSSL